LSIALLIFLTVIIGSFFVLAGYWIDCDEFENKILSTFTTFLISNSQLTTIIQLIHDCLVTIKESMMSLRRIV